MPIWPESTIGEVCRIVNGGTPKTNVAEFWDGNHRWITPAEMGKRNTPYIAESARTLTDAGLKNSSAQLLPPNSIILSSRAPIGYVVINTEPMAFNQGCKGLIPNASLNHKFLYYFLTSIVDLLNDLGTGATFRELSGGKLKTVRLPLIPFAEQERIVAILDEAFSAIDAAVASAEKNVSNARELFGGYLDYVFGNYRQEWAVKTLGSISERVSVGHVGSTTEFYCNPSEGIPFVRSQNVRPGFLDLNGVKHVTRDFHAKLKKSKLQAGDLLFVRVGANRGDCCFVPEGIGELNCANIVFARPRGCSIEFLEYYCRSAAGRDRLLGMTTGSAQGVINTKSVAMLPVPTPPLHVQQQVSKGIKHISTDVERLSAVYERKLILLNALKHSILQKAFAGELTAKEADRQMAAV